MNTSIYTVEFVASIRAALGDGSTPVYAGKVATLVGLDESDADIVRSVVRRCLSEYESVRGQHGGIRLRKPDADTIPAPALTEVAA